MKLPIFLSILLISTSPVQAFQGASMSERLVEKAEQLLMQDKSKDAVELFTRAAFADPLNWEAVDGFVRAALIESNALPIVQSTVALEDLNTYVHRLMRDKSYYIEKISLLKSTLLSRGATETEILKEFEISDLVSDLNNTDLDINFNNKSQDLMQTIFILSEYLTTHKRGTEQEVDYLKQKYQYLRDFNVGLNDLERKEWRVAQRDSQKSISLVKGENLSLSKTELEMIVLTKSVEELQRKVDLFEGHLEIKTQKVVELTQQVISLALQLAEKDLNLSERVEALSSLEVGFDELQSRFELGQRLIQQKDEKIALLESSLNEEKMASTNIQQRLKASLFLKDQKNSELDGIVSIYKDHLTQVNEQLKMKQADFQTMEDQLTFVQSRLLDKNRILQKTSIDIAKLEQNFERIQAYLSSDSDLSEFANAFSPEEFDIFQNQLLKIQTYLKDELEDFNRMNAEILLGESYLE